MKKILSVLLVALMCISLCACGGESKEVQEAKECIDNIYKYTKELSSKRATINNLTKDDRVSLAKLEAECIVAENMLDINTRKLESLYEEMSDKEREIIKQYTDEAYDNYLDSIWNEF